MEVIENFLSPLEVGDNGSVSIPSADRGRVDAAYLLAVIIEEKYDKFRIGNKEGILSTWLERNRLVASKYCSLMTANIQQNEYLLRELVRLGSVEIGQGY
jgi:hypothetical protein